MAKTKRVGMVAMIAVWVVGLLVGGLALWWLNSPPGFSFHIFLDPDDYMGRTPLLMRMETHPRLVPWRLVSPVEVDTTVLMVVAESYACNLGKGGEGQVKETLDRVEVRETADTVTIETWLGPPEGDGFWPGCKGTGTGFSVQVELGSPLGARQFVDPACNLDRHAGLVDCRNTFDSRWKFGSRTEIDSP